MRHLLIIVAAAVLVPASSAGQRPALTIRHQYDIPARCAGITMTMRHDARDRPYLYVASKDDGLKIYRVDAAPRLVRTIAGAALRSLNVMNLSQAGDYVYLALGDHFSTRQSPGFAIVDVRDPEKAAVLSVWHDPSARGGAGVVEAVGDYVYLGAMRNGLLIFDAADKRRPALLSRFVPDIRYPDAKPDPAKYNARGITIRGSWLYLSYDAGGLRIIDVADPRRPIEAGRFANPALKGRPRAYNNAVLDGDLLHVAVDYCGVETLDVSNPARITLAGWWNPWDCQAGPMRWFSSEGHANEVAFDPVAKLLFISTGKSDMHVVSTANPRALEPRAVYGGVENGIGTWGVSRHRNRVYLSYICTLGIPFPSRWTGVKVLTYE